MYLDFKSQSRYPQSPTLTLKHCKLLWVLKSLFVFEHNMYLHFKTQSSDPFFTETEPQRYTSLSPYLRFETLIVVLNNMYLYFKTYIRSGV